MKFLIIIAIVLSAGAVGAGVYSLVETHPNYESARSRYERSSGRGRMADLDFALYRSYEEALKMQIILGPWASGGVALIIGLVGVIKKRKLGFVPIALSVVAIVLSFVVQPAHW